MGVGSVFLPVAGVGKGNTYKLKDLVVQFDDPEEFMYPDAEYFQMLNPLDTEVKERYSYVSEEFLRDNFDGKDWDDKYLNAIGWWKYNKKIADFIEDDDYSTMCGEDEIPVGTAFLSLVSQNRKYRIVSSGAVPMESSGLTTSNTRYLYWLNYLPTKIDINALSVVALDKSGEISEDDFIYPDAEYFQVLSPVDTDVIARYSYVSEAFLRDTFDGKDWDDKYLNAIGWWQYNKKLADFIEDDDYTTKLVGKNKVELTPGFAFLSLVSDKRNYRINFPAAVEVEK